VIDLVVENDDDVVDDDQRTNKIHDFVEQLSMVLLEVFLEIHVEFVRQWLQ
jgi:hypothetical protein